MTLTLSLYIYQAATNLLDLPHCHTPFTREDPTPSLPNDQVVVLLLFQRTLQQLIGMGQINCQCQYISSDDIGSFKHQSPSLPLLATEQTEPTQIIVKMTLISPSKVIDIPLSEATRTSLGTTDDSHHRHLSPNNIAFKVEVRYRNRCAYLKDCGVGLGVFLMKRKVVRRAGSPEILLSVLDKWIVLRVLHSRQITYSLYHTQGNSSAVLDGGEHHQIDLDGCKLSIKSDEEGKDYTIRRSDRKEVWVLLGEERRVKPKDVLRLGLELFQVQGISTYLQSSKIIRKY